MIIIIFIFILRRKWKSEMPVISLCCVGPAPAGVTEKIFEISKTIKEYRICPDLVFDISKIETTQFQVEGAGQFTVQVIDSVTDYNALMKTIFDFGVIKKLLTGGDGKPGLRILINSLHGGQLVH